MSSSSWGNKLETKLATLTEASSKESLQTIAKWMTFNRKRASDFVPILRTHLKVPAKQVVVVGIIHEVLLMERTNSSKWDKLQDLRVVLGEEVLAPAVEGSSGEPGLGSAARDKMQEMLKEWDDVNVFGDPTLLNRLRKKLQEQPTEQPTAAVAEVVAAATREKEESQKTPKQSETAQENKAEAAKATAPKPADKEPATSMSKPTATAAKATATDTTSAAANTAAVDNKTPNSNITNNSCNSASSYDFERHGIPQAHVEPLQFLEPCRAIATLQIARDLRNDGAMQLSSLFSAMPEDIREACATAVEQDNHYELDEATARDFSLRIQETLLDMDMDEQLQNAKTFRNIIERQRKARQELIELLIKSRCKFGADEAAAAYYRADSVKPELLKRKQILSDAMELEGLDVMGDDKKAASQESEAELPPLTWYKPTDDVEMPESKRLRTE